MSLKERVRHIEQKRRQWRAPATLSDEELEARVSKLPSELKAMSDGELERHLKKRGLL